MENKYNYVPPGERYIEYWKDRKYDYYLAHPILIRDEVRRDELYFEKTFPMINLINPFYDVEGSEDIKLVDSGERQPWEEGLDHYGIVSTDLGVILRPSTRGTVVVLSPSIPTIGTVIELVETVRFHKEAYVLTSDPWNFHPWLKVYADKIFLSWNVLGEYLTERRRQDLSGKGVFI